MFDRLPPLQTLRAFEAAARYESMTLAANELHLTHGAVSRHVKSLENYLGILLFQRQTRKIVLTKAGSEFYLLVSKMMGELTRGIEDFRNYNGVTRLEISTSVSFASKWLGPRLFHLKNKFPEIEIYLDVTDINIDLNNSQIDAAIRYGHGNYPNVISERILSEIVTPVCSPSYLNSFQNSLKPTDLVHCVLLHEDRMLANWEQWFNKAGVSKIGRLSKYTYSHGSMAIEAAIRGEGMVLGRSSLIADDIAAGLLVAPFPEIYLNVERGYDLVYRRGSENHPEILILRQWLHEELQNFNYSLDKFIKK